MIERRLIRLCVLSVVVVFLGVVGPLAAQDNDPNFWGTGTNFHFVSAEEFVPRQYTVNWRSDGDDGGNDFWKASGSGNGEFVAPVRLPTGSLITGMTVIYHDSLAGFDLEAKLMQFWVTAPASAGSSVIGPLFQPSGSPGYAAVWVDIDPDHTVLYIDGATAQSYALWVKMPLGTDVALRGIIVGWNRQISPAPAEATFADVPVGAFGFKHVEALAASGITAGCGGGNFCPNQPLTRVQMAVFLAKALGLHWAP